MEIVIETCLDSIKMLTFLFFAFLLIEFLEYYSGGMSGKLLKKVGKAGPVVGAVLGCVPQCGFSVLADVYKRQDLTIEEGEFVSVVGSNGSGKTSMLNIICGSIPVESGQILMQGRDITKEKEYKRNRKIGKMCIRDRYSKMCKTAVKRRMKL